MRLGRPKTTITTSIVERLIGGRENSSLVDRSKLSIFPWNLLIEKVLTGLNRLSPTFVQVDILFLESADGLGQFGFVLAEEREIAVSRSTDTIGDRHFG